MLANEREACMDKSGVDRIEEASYIAVDLGAESGRVMLATLDGQRFSIQEMHRFANGPVEDAGELHWDFQRLIGEIYTGIKKALATGTNVRSIGVDTWGVDYGLLDADGQLLENPFNYRDSRTEGMIDAACEVLPREDIYQNTGIQFMPFNTLYQLMGCKRKRPELLEKAKHLLFMPDLVSYYLCGNISAEYTIASTSQLMDMKTGQWSDVILDAFDLPKDILPSVIRPGTVAGQLKAELAEKWGCDRIPVISVGAHDTASAVAAVPADSEGKWAYLSSGTWSLMGVEASEAIINEQTEQLQFTNEGGVEGTVRLLKNIMGLWLVQECKRQWADEGCDLDYTEITEMASEAAPFQGRIDPDHGAFFSPGQMPEKINDYLKTTGQQGISDKGQMVRVILESLAVRYSKTLETLETLSGDTINTLHIVGGGCQNELLNQFTANATGKTVVAGPIEATVLGNTLMQGLADGQIDSLGAGRQIVRSSFELKEFQPEQSSDWQQYITEFDN